MKEGNRMTDAQLEHELRRLLRARAQSAPMPAGVVEIPNRWTKLARRRWLSPVRWVGVMAAGAVLIALVTQLPRVADVLGPSNTAVTAEAAAAVAGVPVNQVVETPDGAIALRLLGSPPREVQVILVTSADGGLHRQVLTQQTVPPMVLDDESSTIWAELLSCSVESGLHQPNLIFGAASLPTQAAINLPAVGIRHERFFLFVLNDADLDGRLVRVSVTNGSAEWPGAMFDREDECTGAPPRRH